MGAACAGQGKQIERLYRWVRYNAIPGGSEEVLLDMAIRQAVAKAKKLQAGDDASTSLPLAAKL